MINDSLEKIKHNILKKERQIRLLKLLVIFVFYLVYITAFLIYKNDFLKAAFSYSIFPVLISAILLGWRCGAIGGISIGIINYIFFYNLIPHTGSNLEAWLIGNSIYVLLGIFTGIIRDIIIHHQKINLELTNALTDIKKINGLIPICSNCKKMRDENGCWHVVGHQILEKTDVQITHGLCPECLKKLYPDFKRIIAP